MQGSIGYVGEAVAATGFALIGARIYTPEAADTDAVWAALAEARRDCDLVLLNQAHANALGERVSGLLREQPQPPLLVVPGMERDEAWEPVVLQRARRALGLA